MARMHIIDTLSKIGETAELAGWVDNRRDHGKLIFLDLRDETGLIQVVITPSNQELYKVADTLRPEWVVRVMGLVKERPEKMCNDKLPTGTIEFEITKLEILNEAETPPLDIAGDGYEIGEEVRLEYRYLDLRRARLQKNLRTRSKIIQYIREYLTKENFVEIETPILTKSTPEGARDYVVPSRRQPGKFYALPQSPQQYKQLLMVAGFEKYFQIARCFRDEDTRGDRQLEFTQLDIEMSFVTTEDILSLVEKLYSKLIRDLFPEKHITQLPFPRITYREAMAQYKSDKPDLRKDTNNPNELAFAFIVDFPMFEWDEKDKKWISAHHPFTMMREEDLKYIDSGELGKIRANSYDFVLNGCELASGSIRINKPDVQSKVFELLGLSPKEIQDKFGHIIRAFQHGAPPHGGIAPGIDRFVMLMMNEPNIREVIAYPKTGDGRDPMMDSPAHIEKKQLDELGLHIKPTNGTHGV